MITKYIEILGFLVHVYPIYMNDHLGKQTAMCISTAQAVLLFLTQNSRSFS